MKEKLRKTLSKKKKMALNLKYDAVVIGSDHAGFEMKEHVKSVVNALGAGKVVTVEDVGCHSPDRCDYPDLGFAVVDKYAELRKASESKDAESKVLAICVCGSGIGISIAASKRIAKLGLKGSDAKKDAPHPGCTLLHCVTTARYARDVMGTDCIALGGRTTGTETIKEIVAEFLVN